MYAVKKEQANKQLLVLVFCNKADVCKIYTYISNAKKLHAEIKNLTCGQVDKNAIYKV